MKTAVGYIRVSTQEQVDDGHSLEMQETRIKAYCEAAGIELVGVFADNGTSGSVPLSKRKQGRAMLETVASGQANNIVSFKLDRLFRDVLDCLQNVLDWEDNEVGLHLIDMGGQALDTTTAMGKAFLQIAATFAELERGLCVERTKAVKANERAKGNWLGGIPPFGYFHQDGKMYIAEPEADKVRKLFQGRVTGLSLVNLSNRHSTPPSTIHKILHNPVYAGLQRDKAGNLEQSPVFPAIVPVELWEEVNHWAK